MLVQIHTFAYGLSGTKISCALAPSTPSWPPLIQGLTEREEMGMGLTLQCD